ncbi:DNA cytosine methyltransferase [Escherichia marmotae]|jgi:DNA (cytosine-5)-methyltransferase 1|uniref:DNA cytosine methyltransferase n=1 Tax=Escherichia marmotae TaxID=1499973 RepID=UPI001769806D|nr:DNA cytosine methyltransferase [Escherichia marmotae]HAI8717339.1 DNA cytosine methyltransferase [Escherichia coli]MEC9628839.1 DNA cytosine methyltransferase [Escherichia marmotae]MEC9821548.1 DNA cytosine methyltransferase [Escherichia marmotae]MEC9915267.1 DNA cytosine methyltransferase [Escherichia marmotae]MEC9931311.1 DNA cytosine methyltransferase [Escherichia marmotae]
MSEFELLVKDLLLKSEEDEKKRQEKDRELISKVLEIYDQKYVAELLRKLGKNEWSRETLNRWINGKCNPKQLTSAEETLLRKMLPEPPEHHPNYTFRFIDLFAGIGGIRKGFENIGGQCVFTSEWNKEAVRTYKANWFNDELNHKFNLDIREVTLSDRDDVSEVDAYNHIDKNIPDHDVLLAGFPCQPFSLAGVSKKNSLGRAHGFECEAQGTLFFDVARIIKSKKPAIFVLENVKNLKSHDKGKTFKVIMETLDELGYEVADAGVTGSDDPKIIDGKHFLPQHRERIVLVGFRRDLNIHNDFTLRNINHFYPQNRPTFGELLDHDVDKKYILTPRLWEYLYNYAKKHAAKGNGFGFGLVDPKNPDSIARTLSARYHKDGSEILIDRGWDKAVGEIDFSNPTNQENRPRRLTPHECARLMGFEKPGGRPFRIPVSDTQAYRQFGNSVIVPVFEAVARLLEPYIQKAVNARVLND